MRKIITLTLLITCYSISYSQTSSWEAVYNLIQSRCSSCHVPGHISGLNLAQPAGALYTELYNTIPTNLTAAGKNYKLVKPGNPYKSFLFSKINNGLALDVFLETGEGIPCPQDAAPLDNKQIELVRQWILFGAPETGFIADETIIADFYDNDGIQSVPSPPAPPESGTGFQIHFGPFFLWPGEEYEYWDKYDPDLGVTTEIIEFETVMNNYSHHFLMYKFNNPDIAETVSYGLHDGPDFSGVDVVFAQQFSDSLNLPAHTAFSWDANTLLDLNSHYINYSPDKTMACEVYINVYTQTAGTAIQLMQTIRKSNPDLYIPNDSVEHTFVDTAYGNGHGEDELFVWAMTSHTHKYGSDFDIYKRNEDGSLGEQIFDASCEATLGAPGCLDEIYDYQHPPTRRWDNMLPVKWKNGFIYKTSFINNGPEPVSFGMTTEDEMAVFMYFFVDDTTGLNLNTAITTTNNNALELLLYPNPVNNNLFIKTNIVDYYEPLMITDLNGFTQTLLYGQYQIVAPGILSVDISKFAAGIYTVQLIQDKKLYAEKMVKF